MQDERNRVCRHIRAARDWLGEAEDSLQAEQDVKGDLKLLLARAELQHVQEKRKLKDVGKRLLIVAPLSLLVLFAAGTRFYHTTPEAPPVGRVSSSAEAQPENAPLQKQIEPVVSDVPEPVSENGPESFPQEYPAEPAAVEPAAASVREEPMREDNSTEPAVRQEQTVPSRDMQKLMQSAGSVLRAQ